MLSGLIDKRWQANGIIAVAKLLRLAVLRRLTWPLVQPIAIKEFRSPQKVADNRFVGKTQTIVLRGGSRRRAQIRARRRTLSETGH